VIFYVLIKQGSPRGASAPLLSFHRKDFPLSVKKGEGDKGGEVDKQSPAPYFIWEKVL